MSAPLVHTRAQMSTERLEGQVKTRVPKLTKAALEQIATERHLDVSDIVREALRQYIARNGSKQMEPSALSEKVADAAMGKAA